MTYAERVAELEAAGLCTSDAQGCADVEQLQGRAFDFDPEFPLDNVVFRLKGGAMKPATPLPWKVDENNELPPAVIEDTEDGIGVCEEMNAQDAAYIVAACNAYPKLVAALREIANLPDGDFYDCPLGKVRLLLRSLGEE